MREVNKICKEKKILLIVDEITSGWRDCKGGIYKKIGLNPDLVIYGKALGNGFAISAVIGKEKVMDIAQDTFVSSTAWTERVGFAAGLAVINFITKERCFLTIKIWVNKLKKDGLDLQKNTILRSK